MLDESALADILERVRYRFYGKYRGTVTKIDKDTLRIKAMVPAVLGTQETGWCASCVPYAGKEGVGVAFTPEEGAGVWIEFEGGDVSYPIWTGCYWRTGELPADAKPNVKVLATKGKFKIILDADKPSAVLTDKHENKITMDSDGITIERGGKKVVVKSASVTINDDGLEVL